MEDFMRLRELKKEDALLMLNWMHDDNVTCYLQEDFESKKLSDCEMFIEKSKDKKNNYHMAIVDDNDNYVGTVSLKNINKKAAEFAIVISTDSMGKGFSSYAMKEIIKIGLEKIGLESIYWCVSANNIRAIKFYDKLSFKKTDNVPLIFIENYKNQKTNYLWYCVKKSELTK